VPRDLVAVVVLMTVLLMARASLADHYVVPTGSMQPTVHVGDRVIVLKAAYGIRLPLSQIWLTDAQMPARGEVVALTSPEDGHVLLKRVVAIGGDVVSVRRGSVFIDGLPQADRHRSLLYGGGPDFGPARVPAGQLLVMGDNRGGSHDGRSFGFVPVEAMLGRATGIFMRDGSPGWIPLD
jgi:signal peptidase I